MTEILACLCGCGRLAQRRGLAFTCYQRLRSHILAGKTTWEALVAAGKALPAKRSQWGRPGLEKRAEG